MPLVPGFFFGRNGKSREYYGRVIVCSEQGFLSLAELFFFFFKIFSWKIIALQYCAASATSTWISHSNTHIPSLSTSLPSPRPLACTRALGWAPCVTQQMPTGYLFHICYCICFHSTLSIHPTLSFPLCVHKSASLWLPCKVHQYHLSRFHTLNLSFLKISQQSH